MNPFTRQATVLRLGTQQHGKAATIPPSAVLKKATYLFDTHRQPANVVGEDQEVRMKANLINCERSNVQLDNIGDVKGWTIKETWQMEVQNSRKIDVLLDIRRTFNGDWSLKTDAIYEKVDAAKVRFLLRLKAREKRTFSYEVTMNLGAYMTR